MNNFWEEKENGWDDLSSHCFLWPRRRRRRRSIDMETVVKTTYALAFSTSRRQWNEISVRRGTVRENLLSLFMINWVLYAKESSAESNGRHPVAFKERNYQLCVYSRVNRRDVQSLLARSFVQTSTEKSYRQACTHTKNKRNCNSNRRASPVIYLLNHISTLMISIKGRKQSDEDDSYDRLSTSWWWWSPAVKYSRKLSFSHLSK